MALGGGARPPYRAGLGGRRPRRRRALSYDEVASGSGSPSRRSASARQAAGHRRGTAGPGARHRARSPACSGRDLTARTRPPRAGAASCGRASPCWRRGGWSPRGRSIWAPASLVLLLAPQPRSRRRRRCRDATGRDNVLVAVWPGCSRSPAAGRSRPRCSTSSTGITRTRGLDRRPARCCAAAPGSARWSGWRSSPVLAPAGPRAWPSCSPSRAWAATPSCATPRTAAGRRRAVHHRHLHQRALGGRLRGLPRSP